MDAKVDEAGNVEGEFTDKDHDESINHEVDEAKKAMRVRLTTQLLQPKPKTRPTAQLMLQLLQQSLQLTIEPHWTISQSQSMRKSLKVKVNTPRMAKMGNQKDHMLAHLQKQTLKPACMKGMGVEVFNTT